MMTSLRPKLVILGSGFGSFSLLKDIDTKRYSVTVISPRNHFLFTPLLPSTTVGTVEFRSIIEPIRIARRGIRMYQAWCEGIDTERQVVKCRGAFKGSDFEVEYDTLVIGVGGISNTFGIPGVEEHAVFLKELSDARAIRQKIIENFERACKPNRPEGDLKQLLHFVVVGGGPTGVEFAAEMHDFVTEDLEQWFPDLMPYVRITLLEATDKILMNFHQKLGEYALRRFRRQRINVRLNSFVTQIEEDDVAYEVSMKDDASIHCGLVVWSTGIGPTRLVRGLDFPKSENGRLVTDETFLVKGRSNVYAIGDCATIEGQDLPATAQVAQQVGGHLAKTLNSLAKGGEPYEFQYKHKGMLAYVGSHRALADMGEIQTAGVTTWFFWRSAYLTKLVSWKNKFLVFTDWLKSSIFGRDISRF